MTESPGLSLSADIAALAVDVHTLQTYPGNPRRGDLKRIAESLSTNGQYRPIVYQTSTRYILAGNHTYLAARSIGWDTIAAIGVDVDEQTAKRIVAADNRTADLGDYDNDALAALLESIDDLTGTGYTDIDVAQLLADLDDTDEGMPPAGDASTEEEIEHVWGVIVTCVTEDEQTALLERLGREGLDVRAVMR